MCVYVCIYVCVFVCKYVCIYVSLYICAMILKTNFNGFYTYDYTQTAIIFVVSLSDESL